MRRVISGQQTASVLAGCLITSLVISVSGALAQDASTSTSTTTTTTTAKKKHCPGGKMKKWCSKRFHHHHKAKTATPAPAPTTPAQ